MQSKEGLALLNGTQFMSSYAVWCLQRIEKLLVWADTIATISFDGFDLYFSTTFLLRNT
ncbi:MAG: aromatic amino acid lyase [Bacteroidetes bacterium]|nr:aromatic amino acid lyase [Bacteroidota bacterium]